MLNPTAEFTKYIVVYPGGVNVRKTPSGISELTGEHLEPNHVFDGSLTLQDDGIDDCYTQLKDGRGWIPLEKGNITVATIYLETPQGGRRGSAVGFDRRGSAMDMERRGSTSGSILTNLARKGSVASSSPTGRRGSNFSGSDRRFSALNSPDSPSRRGSNMFSTPGNAVRRISTVNSSRKASLGGGGYIELGAPRPSDTPIVQVSEDDLEAIAEELRAEMLNLTARQAVELETKRRQQDAEDERVRRAREKERILELDHVQQRAAIAKKASEDTQATIAFAASTTEQRLREMLNDMETHLKSSADLAELRVQAAAESRLRIAAAVLEKEVSLSREREATVLRELQATREREEAERMGRLEAEEALRVRRELNRGALLARRFEIPLTGIVFYDSKLRSSLGVSTAGHEVGLSDTHSHLSQSSVSSEPRDRLQVLEVADGCAAQLLDVAPGDVLVGILERPLLGVGLELALQDPETFPCTLLFERDEKKKRRMEMLVFLEKSQLRRADELRREANYALALAKETVLAEQQAFIEAREKHALVQAERARRALERGRDLQRRPIEQQLFLAEDCLNVSSESAPCEQWRQDKASRGMAANDTLHQEKEEALRVAEASSMTKEEARSYRAAECFSKSRRQRALRLLRIHTERREKLRAELQEGVYGIEGFTGHAYGMLVNAALSSLAERLQRAGQFHAGRKVLARALDVLKVTEQDANEGAIASNQQASTPLDAQREVAVVFEAPPLGFTFEPATLAPISPVVVTSVEPGGRAARWGLAPGDVVESVLVKQCDSHRTDDLESVLMNVDNAQHLVKILLGQPYPLTVLFRRSLPGEMETIAQLGPEGYDSDLDCSDSSSGQEGRRCMLVNAANLTSVLDEWMEQAHAVPAHMQALQRRKLAARLLAGEDASQLLPPRLQLTVALEHFAELCTAEELADVRADVLSRRLALLEEEEAVEGQREIKMINKALGPETDDELPITPSKGSQEPAHKTRSFNAASDLSYTTSGSGSIALGLPPKGLRSPVRPSASGPSSSTVSPRKRRTVSD